MSPTPILDLEQDPPRPLVRRWWTALLLGAGIGLGGIVLLLAAALLGWYDPETLPDLPPLNLWLFLPALYAAVFLHEAGHLAVAKLAGFSAGGICVGGLMLLRSGERWTVRFDRRYLFGGLAVPLPSQRDFRRGRYAWVVAGGPVASILFSGICWLALHRSGAGTWDWISTLFLAAVYTILASAIPYQFRGCTSDALRLWQLFRNPGWTRRWMAVVALQAENMRGVRPREWTSETFEQALESVQSEQHYSAVQMLAAYRAADLGDDQRALQHLERALSVASQPAVTRWCYLEASVASAKHRRNPAQARIWLERASKVKTTVRRDDTAGIQAQIAMAEGDYAGALQHWTRYRGLLERLRLDTGTARFGKEKISEAEADCRIALAATTPPAEPSAAL